MKLSFCCPLVLTITAIATAGEDPPQVSLRVPDGPQVALWQKAPTPNKPYIAQLFAPGDKPIPLLDDSPPDHFHHHGLMLALGVETTDFWTEKGVDNVGRQESLESVTAAAGDGFSQRLRWLATDGTPLLEEVRQVRVRATGKGVEAVHWLDWESTLTPAAGRTGSRLWGRHYFGLGLRFLPAWSNHGTFIWQDTAGQTTVRGDEKLTPGGWCAASLTIEGCPVSVLMIDHPSNPRPARWFTMSQPFCYMTATPNLEDQPLVLKAGKSWTLRYGLAVLSTPADHANLAALATEWKNSNIFPDKKRLIPAHP